MKYIKPACLGLALSMSCLVNVANAGVITSVDDTALQGAQFVDFQEFALGEHNELNFDGGIFESTGSTGSPNNFQVSDNYTPYNNGEGRAFSNRSDFSTFSLTFDNDISAFGLTMGAVNKTWDFTLFDADGKSIDNYSFVMPENKDDMSARYIGFEASNIRSISFTPALWDNVAFDSLSFVQGVPAPSTLAIFALGLMGLVSRRFAKKS